MTYSNAEREEALALYREVGPAKAARRLEIPAATIRSRASRGGLATVAAEETGPGAVFIGREERHEEVVDAAIDRILEGHRG